MSSVKTEWFGEMEIAKMQTLCVLLLLVGVALADPSVYFVEKFETGKGIWVDSAVCMSVWVDEHLHAVLLLCLRN